MRQTEGTTTRFAPSPNGNLHLGHAYSAIFAYDLARSRGGDFLLRIEDIDGPRSRSDIADNFRRDLEWLGVEWIEVPQQSSRLDGYVVAAQKLIALGLLYPCTFTRKQLEALPARTTPNGLIYPGTSKGLPMETHEPAALRLDVDKAMAIYSDCVWTDEKAGSVVADPRLFGDAVIVRKDLPASYHLAVTLDDAEDGITDVTRGSDLFAATHIHRLLQEALELPVPHWHHHPLVLDENGKKLSKSRNSPPLCERRKAGEDGRALAAKLRAGEISTGT